MRNGLKIFLVAVFLVVIIWYFFRDTISEKYEELGLKKANPSVLKVTDGAGVLSCLSIRLDNYCNNPNRDQILDIDSSCQFDLYKDNPNQDISKILFQPYNPNIEIPPCDFKHSWQFQDYNKIHVEDLHKIAMNVCNPSELVRKTAYDIFKLIDNRCVVSYRGNDKSKEIKPIPYDEVIKVAKTLNEHRFFVQTDEKEFFDYFKSKFPDTISYFGIPMMNKNTDKFSTGYDNEGKSPFAVKFLSLIYAISKSRRVILPTGNTGLWIVIYRGTMEGIHQLKGECTEDMYCDIVNKY